MRHECYLTREDFPTHNPVYGIDEKTGEDHGTEAEFEAGCDLLCDRIVALIPGAVALWSQDDHGLHFLVYWDERREVAEDYANRETGDPEFEIACDYSTIRDELNDIAEHMKAASPRERMLSLEKAAR